ncbi:MAG: response regulator transcription factor [Acidobacteriota bacterium]
MSDAAVRILLVEDEEAIAEGLLRNFRRKGWQPTLAVDGEEALAKSASNRFDLVVLDVRLPKVDGFEVCRRLRDGGDLTPILMLTARDQPDDMVYGLRLGADDYVTKPFDLAVLLARMEGLLRRGEWTKPAAQDNDSPAVTDEEGSREVFGEFWIDFATWHALTLKGVVELSRKEIAVMRLLLNREGQVVSRRDLLAEVWDLPDHPNTRVVDNVILSLRKAFEHEALKPRHIHNVRGVGYRFES